MFGRKKGTPEDRVVSVKPETTLPEKQKSQEQTGLSESMGAVALQGQNGFTLHENGLFLPDKATKVSLLNEDVLAVTDSRRVTLKSVEENFKAEQAIKAEEARNAERALKAEQERLDSPLNRQEIDAAIELIRRQMGKRNAEYRGDDDTYRNDIQRDTSALSRLKSALVGTRDIYVEKVTKSGEALSASEMLGRVVAQYAKLVPENFGEDSFIGSMGGTVDIPENGIIHCSGYNGSILYEFARAFQMAKKIEEEPRDVRTRILEADLVDAEWLYEEPVVVDRELTKIPEGQLA